MNKSVVTSEIFNLYEGNVVDSNKFSYSNSNYKVHPLMYVDHYVNPFLATPSLSETPSNSLIETIVSSNENTNIFDKNSDVYTQSRIEHDFTTDHLNDANSHNPKNMKKYNLKSSILLIIIFVEVISSVILVIVIAVVDAKYIRYQDDFYININQDDDLSI